MEDQSLTGCAASTPRQIPDDWREWLATNLMMGAAPEPLMERMMQEGFCPDMVREEVSSAQCHPYVAAGRLHAQRVKKRDWVFDCMNLLRDQSANGHKIERRYRISRDEFYETYYFQNRPVVITGTMDDWPALTQWTPEYLKSRFGHLEVEIQVHRSENPEYEIDKDRHRSLMLFGDYVDLVNSGVETNDYYLTAANSGHNGKVLKELFQDIRLISDYLKPDEGSPGFLWYGPKGIVTPLHHDLTNNFMAQILGKKRIFLIPPSQLPHIYNHKHCFSAVDLTNIDYERFPEFKHITLIEVILEPGELLFLPIGYWHHVTGLDIVATITFTNFLPHNDFSFFYSTYGPL
jgi:hypothetical protein